MKSRRRRSIRLTAEQRRVTREAGTERPFTGSIRRTAACFCCLAIVAPIFTAPPAHAGDNSIKACDLVIDLEPTSRRGGAAKGEIHVDHGSREHRRRRGFATVIMLGMGGMRVQFV
jgi:hypothetical protein